MSGSEIREIPLGGGMDQKTSVEWLDPSARQILVQDGNYVKTDAVDKRLGYGHVAQSLLGGGPSGMVLPTSGNKLASWTRANLVQMSAAAGLYTFAPAEGQLAAVSPLPDVVPIRRPIVAAPTAFAPILCDFPSGSSTLRLAVYAGPPSGATTTIYATVYDATTGDVVLEPTKIYTQTSGIQTMPLAALWLPNAPAGKQVIVFIVDNNLSALIATRYNQATNTFDAATNILNLPGGVDVAPFIGDPNGGFVVAYVSATSSPAVFSWRYFLPDYTHPNSGTIASLAGATADFPLFVYATHGTGEQVWFAFAAHVGGVFSQYMAAIDGGGSLAVTVSPTAFFTGSAAQFMGGIVRVTASTVYVSTYASSHPAGNAYAAMRGLWYVFSTSALAQVDSGTTPTGMLPVARPFVVGTTIYQPALLCLYNQGGSSSTDVKSQQNTLYLWRLAAPGLVNRWLPVATVAPRTVDAQFTVLSLLLLGGHLSFTSGAMASVNASTRHAVGLKTIAPEVTALATGMRGGTWAADFYLDAAHQAQALYQAQEYAGALPVSSGVPMVFDAQAVFEDGFFYYPEFTYATISGTGLTGAYGYAVVYAYVDAAGQLHRSAPAFTAIQSATNQSFVLSIPYLSATWRDVTNPGQVYAEIYRTTANGSTYYLADRVVISGTASGYATWPASGADVTTDAALTLSTLLYTTGGVLDNVNPPAALLQIIHRGRKVIVDETLRQTWESKSYTVGEAPGFHEQLVTPYPEGGDITALGSMDDKLVVGKAASIWVRYGDGPADTGQGSDWSAPQRISSDVGMKDQRGLALAPMGLFFQAPNNGIYLLGRDLQVTFIGKSVVDQTSLYPTITSATVRADVNQIRWTASNGTSSVFIVYDYLLDKWAVHVPAQLSADIAHAALTVATPARYALLTTDGQLWQEHLAADATAYMDDDVGGTAHFVSTLITTAHFKTAGPQGYMRARRFQVLFERQSQCGVQLSVQPNFGATFTSQDSPPAIPVASWLSSRLDAYHATGPVSLEYHTHAAISRVMSMSVTLQDQPSDAVSLGNGQGVRWVSLLVDFDPLAGRFRVPAALRACDDARL